MPIELRIIDEVGMTPEMDRAIREALCLCFPADVGTFGRTRAWHGSAPAYSVVAESDGYLVGHLGVVDRTINVGAVSLRVGGVQNVFVLPRCRKTGLADQLMVASMDEALRRRMDAGLLFCLPKLTQVYERCGWIALEPRTVWATRQSGERYALDGKNIAMFHPLLARRFPAGPVDLHGDDW